jgi:hypothetical protein
MRDGFLKGTYYRGTRLRFKQSELQNAFKALKKQSIFIKSNKFYSMEIFKKDLEVQNS